MDQDYILFNVTALYAIPNITESPLTVKLSSIQRYFISNRKTSEARCDGLTPVFSPLKRLRQEDHMFKASLGYISSRLV